MIDYMFLQQYWWFLVSLLGALLVFLMFVQGGQGMLYLIGKTDEDKKMLVNTLGRKWEFTFTTLVTFGGAFFASFPLFYSTSFGGAFYVWMAILFVFVIQAVAYEFRSKAGNVLGTKTYDMFLFINGSVAPLLVGVAVGTFFTGANFMVDLSNIGNMGSGESIISHWTTPWRGLEAVLDYRNLALGVAVLFLSRSLGLLYFVNTIDDKEIVARSRKALWVESITFVGFFLLFLISILFSSGFAVDPTSGVVSMEPYKYFNNLIAMPIVLVMLLVGVVGVLVGLGATLLKKEFRGGIWWAGLGTVLTVLALLLTAGYNNTAYYPSAADLQSSLTIFNSSSSEFTLTVMSYVSLMIPFVVAYIWYSWRAMNKKPVTRAEMKDDSEHTY